MIQCHSLSKHLAGQGSILISAWYDISGNRTNNEMKCYLIHSNHHLNPQSPVKMRFVISAKWRRFQTHYFYCHFHSNSKGDHVKIHSNHSKEDGILTTKINLFNLRREAIVEMILKKPLSWFNNNNWLFFLSMIVLTWGKKKTLNLYIRPICLKIYFPSIQKLHWLLLHFIAFSNFYRKFPIQS